MQKQVVAVLFTKTVTPIESEADVMGVSPAAEANHPEVVVGE